MKEFNYMESVFSGLEAGEQADTYAMKIEKRATGSAYTVWFNVKPAVMEKIKAILIAENE